MNEITLTTKLAGEIKGKFYIPSYQRGYRWGAKDVKFLLEDILSNGTKPFCLQPIVVRKLEDSYELVDGQQRLTTLLLFYKFMHIQSNKFIDDARFSIEYETRKDSQAYLSDIKLDKRNNNIDFWHIANAYEAIEDFFKGKKNSVITLLNQYFDNNVKVIWYEIPETESAVDLFTRLNIGKIPLTSSELVKALFLREDSERTDEIKSMQEEISLQWDNIECDLHDNTLWSFLTNKKQSEYSTLIDLILDLIANKKSDEREEYYTFFYFDQLSRDGKSLKEIWKEIYKSFLRIKGWRYNHELYHKIGYLVASGFTTLADIFHDTKDLKKSELNAYLDQKIKDSLELKGKSYVDLSYDNDKDKAQIERLLLLFNVESVRTLDDGKQWLPFDKLKESYWSLEHIHAQHSKGLETNALRLLWLKAHLESIKSLNDAADSDLVEKMETLIKDIEANPKTTKVGNEFEPIQKSVFERLSDGGSEYIHRISNMALLDRGDNSALSNYVFDAKRNIVIGWDKEGKYIPFCTKMVFFKYYTPSKDNQLHFWGIKDREAYIASINDKLAKYMPEKITE